MRATTTFALTLAALAVLLLSWGCSTRDENTRTDADPESDTEVGDLPEACQDALPLACGNRLTHDTAVQGRPNVWGSYSCTARAENGPETIYAFRTAETCQVAVRLTELEDDIDLLLLDECELSSCVSASSTPLDIQDIEDVSFNTASGQNHYLVVDGYAGASGTYTIEVDCLCGSPAGEFADGDWVMRVDRRWNGESGYPGLPTDLFEEADYQPVEDGAIHEVVISGGWRSVSIGETPLVGELTPNTTGIITYELTSGTFAGGRFNVWNEGSGLQAELTIYGSGVPIVSSERGALVPVE